MNLHYLIVSYEKLNKDKLGEKLVAYDVGRNDIRFFYVLVCIWFR